MNARNGLPVDGWLKAASDSYGTDELFRGTPHTVVRIFTPEAESEARAAHIALLERGVTTATLDEVTHVDGMVYFYVWAERDELRRLVPEVTPKDTLRGIGRSSRSGTP